MSLMKKKATVSNVVFYLSLVVCLSCFCLGQKGIAQNQPIDTEAINAQEERVADRITRKITLDVRDMNIIDVIKFLAIRGDFNVITSKSVEGRVTLYLKSVSIQDALDIILISNNLAYEIKNEIVYVMSQTEFQSAHGRRFNDRSVVKTVRLTYAKPGYVLSTLESIKSSLGKIVIDEDTGTVVMIDTPEAIDRMLEAINEIEQPVETYVYNLQYAKALEIVEKLADRLQENAVGTITASQRSNQVIVRALPARRDEIMAVIKSLDEPTKEVLIEAQILQILFNPQFDFGIDWTMDFQDSSDPHLRKLSFQNILLDESNLTSSSNLLSKYARLAIGSISADSFALSLRALKKVSDTKVLSNPRILVANNEEAKIHVGDTVPYIISTTSGTGDNAITSEDVRFVDVGLKLNVSATINDEGFVSMKLLPEISSVVGTIDSKGGGIPQVNKTMVETSVIVKDGTTIIMGGLKKEEKKQVRQGVPFLMDMPWIGNIFKSTSDQVTMTEIVILITPHIVTGQEHYEDNKGNVKPYKKY